MFDMSNYFIIPLYSIVKIYCISFDVIHSFGINSFGIKIDSIPGQINLAATIRAIIKGEHRGFCYELCGQGHSSMLLLLLSIYSYSFNTL
jgi:cytochrome c oxidase subunit 2